MNKTQNVTAFAEKAGITKTDASKFFNDLICVMADNIVEGDGEISIPDFGRFSIKHVAERRVLILQQARRLPLQPVTRWYSRLLIAFHTSLASIVMSKLG